MVVRTYCGLRTRAYWLALTVDLHALDWSSAYDDVVACNLSSDVILPILELSGRCLQHGVHHDGLLDASTRLLNHDSAFYQKHAIIARVSRGVPTPTRWCCC